jgi:PAS domain S-box-containing protein
MFLTHSTKGNIQLFDPESGTLAILVDRGFEAPFLEFFDRVHDQSAVCGTAFFCEAGSGRRCDTESNICRKTSLDVLLAAEVRAVQSTPLISSSSKVLGTISTHFSQPKVFHARELRLMDLLARQVADYLERTRAEDERRRAQSQLRESEERLERALRGAGLGTWDWNIETGAAVFNSRWAEMRGFSLDEVKPHVDSWSASVHPDDWPQIQQSLMHHFPGLTSEYEGEYRVRTKSGSWIWVLARGKVFTRGENDRPLRMIGTELDITYRKRFEINQTFLSEVGALLGSSLEYEQTLDSIAELAVRDLADICIIDVVGETGKVARLKVKSREASLAPLCDLFMRAPLEKSRPLWFEMVFETKRPVFVDHFTPEMIEYAFREESVLQVIHEAGLQSALAIPLVRNQRLVGSIVLISCSASHIYGPGDLYLAEELARRAESSIENARLFF